MSGFVEALLPTKVCPLGKKEKDDEEEEERRLMIRDMEREGYTNTKNREEDDLGRRIEQPQKDVQASPTQRDDKSTPIARPKELVLPKIDTPYVRESKEADVHIVSLSIVCPNRPEIILSHPFISSPKACLFTLKEGTKYRLKFSFIVSNKVVSGLKYENTLWKAGIRVDRSTVSLGNFNPRQNPYIYKLGEDTLPSGLLVRGLYSARAKVIDSDGKCYMDIHYHFDIQKKWPLSSS